MMKAVFRAKYTRKFKTCRNGSDNKNVYEMKKPVVPKKYRSTARVILAIFGLIMLASTFTAIFS